MIKVDNLVNIFVAGHKGMVGSAIVRRIRNLDGVHVITRNRSELDLLNQADVKSFFEDNRIDQVYLAAARVGGIHANNIYPAEFIYENLTIQTNLINAAYKANVKKLLFLGSSCIYPRNTNQPITENDLLAGKLELTNEPYAVAKIAGIKMCESYNRQYGTDFRSLMPTNLYGQGDNYHPDNSHVIPGLIYRFDKAIENNESEVLVWGSGKVRREFLYVDDLADASIYVMSLDKLSYSNTVNPRNSHINVGTGCDHTIADLAKLMAEVVGYKGRIKFDTNKPDGVPRKLLDVSLIDSLGWHYSIDLKKGLQMTWEHYKSSSKIRSR